MGVGVKEIDRSDNSIEEIVSAFRILKGERITRVLETGVGMGACLAWNELLNIILERLFYSVRCWNNIGQLGYHRLLAVMNDRCPVEARYYCFRGGYFVRCSGALDTYLQ